MIKIRKLLFFCNFEMHKLYSSLAPEKVIDGQFEEDFEPKSSRLDQLRRKLEEKPYTLNNFLIDKFNRKHTYLRISVVDHCNLKCEYCNPGKGFQGTKKKQLLTKDEIFRLAQLFVREGVNKIRITGGEPLLRKDLMEIIAGINLLKNPEITQSSNVLKSISITTNATVLLRKLKSFKEAGLDSVNISLDTLKPDRFARITGMGEVSYHSRVMEAITGAIEFGFKPVKINCVVMNGTNEDEVNDFVKLTENLPLDVRFIEYMPFGGNDYDMKKLVTYQSMLNDIKKRFPVVSKLDDLKNDTSKAYHVPGYAGQFGFIASMSNPFCGDCNRLRITADGNLKVCLFGEKKDEVSLRDRMRSGESDEKLLEVIRDTLKKKAKQHAGLKTISKIDNRSMIAIGG